MKGKIITALVLTAALTASIAAPTAFAETEGAPVSAVEQQSTQSSITSITTTQDIYKTGVYYNFDIVTVSGTSKLQIKYPTTTGTFHRTHEKVTIADNGDGTETWTVPVKTNDTLTVEARAKIGSTWETEYASAAYEIKQEPVVEQKIVSVSTQQETIFADSKNVPFEIVATTGAAKMQVVYPASTATYTRTHARITITDNGDGTETWTVPAHANANGTATFRVKYKAWSENYVYEYEVKSAEERFVDATVEYALGESKRLSWEPVTLNIVTSSDTNKIRLEYFSYKTAKTTTSTFYATSKIISVTDNGDGTKTWSFTKKYNEFGGYYHIYVAGASNKLVQVTDVPVFIEFDDECDFWEVVTRDGKLCVFVDDHTESVVLKSEDGVEVNLVFEQVSSDFGVIWSCDIPEDGEYTLVAKSKSQSSQTTYTFTVENGERVW